MPGIWIDRLFLVEVRIPIARPPITEHHPRGAQYKIY